MRIANFPTTTKRRYLMECRFDYTKLWSFAAKCLFEQQQQQNKWLYSCAAFCNWNCVCYDDGVAKYIALSLECIKCRRK